MTPLEYTNVDPGSAAMGWSSTNWTQSLLASMRAQLLAGSV